MQSSIAKSTSFSERNKVQLSPLRLFRDQKNRKNSKRVKSTNKPNNFCTRKFNPKSIDETMGST